EADEAARGDRGPLRRWEPRLAPTSTVMPFLHLVACLQLAVGNIVYAWHDKAKEQILSVLEAYLGNRTFKVVFLDDSGSLVVPAHCIRGLVTTDEALMALHDAAYNYRIATEQVAHMVSQRSAAAVRYVRDGQESDEGTSDSSVSSSASSPRHGGPERKRQCKTKTKQQQQQHQPKK
ncbi:hypothetical protein As57867_019922, partial [Aphanomyces stellatus]